VPLHAVEREMLALDRGDEGLPRVRVMVHAAQRRGGGGGGGGAAVCNGATGCVSAESRTKNL
jgi:O-acetyl-ADP-ribose deacetylase (regulator of RNase III)